MLNSQEFIELIDRFPECGVGVLGDLMVDHFIYGTASRLSPEAPVPVVSIESRTTQPGGAANVGNNVLSLGGKLHLYGLLGDDAAGHVTRRQLEHDQADLTGVLLLPERPSTVKTRVVASNQQVVRFDEEQTHPIDESSRTQLLALIEAAAEKLQVLIVSDYAKGIMSAQFAEQVLQICRRSKVKLLVDPKPVNMECFAGADVIKPNLGEALRIAGLEQDPGTAGMRMVCELVLERTGARNVIVTAGRQGMFVLTGDELVNLPGSPREVFDVAGAGDSSLAAIGLAMACGADLVSATRLGNLAGSIAVGKLGITAVSDVELKHEVERFHGQH